jgi:hypothetical protein
MATYQGRGYNVRAVCAEARRALGLRLADSREVCRSGGEDGLYRVYLADGTIVEATIEQVPRVATLEYHEAIAELDRVFGPDAPTGSVA